VSVDEITLSVCIGCLAAAVLLVALNGAPMRAAAGWLLALAVLATLWLLGAAALRSVL